MEREKKRQVAYEVMIFLGVLTLLLFITRLWPIFLLALVGILACALRLLFVSVKHIQGTVPDAEHEGSVMPAPETEQSIIQKAFGLLQQRIAEQVVAKYPAAKWVWSNPRAMGSFAAGEPLMILLNSAGGYQKASVLVENLLFVGVDYIDAEAQPENYTPQTETGSVNAAQNQTSQECEADIDDEPPIVNYERLAFEWVEAYLLEINHRCNDAIAEGREVLLLPSRELPHPDSWLDVCAELKRNGFSEADISDDGITLTLPQ